MPRRKGSTLKLASVLDRALLLSLADERCFARGEAYFAEGRIRSITEWDGVVEAQVEGTETYSVKLWKEGDELGYSCTCPVGEYGDGLCKHCVAVGLAVIKGEKEPDHPLPPAPRFTKADVREYLEGADKKALIRFLLAYLSQDHELRDRLFSQMAQRRKAERRERAGSSSGRG
jgi:uncharacterized Zn finger protein